jgi:hypothetical protein
MAVTRLTGKDGWIDFTLDGLTFYRSESGASARGMGRVHQVEWARIIGAEVTWSRKGRPVVRVAVHEVPSVSRHQRDPHAMKVKPKLAEQAHEFVGLVNEEVGVRRRWQTDQLQSG